MKNKPTKEENKLFEELTGGEAGNLFLMAVEVNGVETTCIFAWEDVPGEEKVLFAPIAILVNDGMVGQIKMPEKFEELTLPRFDDSDDEDEDQEDNDSLFGLPPLNPN